MTKALHKATELERTNEARARVRGEFAIGDRVKVRTGNGDIVTADVIGFGRTEHYGNWVRVKYADGSESNKVTCERVELKTK